MYKKNPFISSNVLWFLLPLLLFSWTASAQDVAQKLTNADCRILDQEPVIPSTIEHPDNALLWKISKASLPPNYIFGTIHISDPEVLELTEEISDIFSQTDTFVMEALPEQPLELSQMFYTDDGTRLTDHLDDELFNRVAAILLDFHLPVDLINEMKPWAAFLTMGYPTDNPMPLDLKLLNMALIQGSATIGLETVHEQSMTLNGMTLADQLSLLLDTVCNYDDFHEDIAEIKQLYLAKDLHGMLHAVLSHPYADEPVYKKFNDNMLHKRNKLMVQRMQAVLNQGNAFIAIGALHLPGDTGVIASLRKKGYQISKIY